MIPAFVSNAFFKSKAQATLHPKSRYPTPPPFPRLPHRDGEQPARDLHHRGTPKVVGKEPEVDGGRHEDQLEVRPGQQQAAHEPQEEVTMQVTLMDFVSNQHVVAGQGGLPLGLAQEQPFRQEDNPCGWRARALKADLVTNLRRADEQERRKETLPIRTRLSPSPSSTPALQGRAVVLGALEAHLQPLKATCANTVQFCPGADSPPPR